MKLYISIDNGQVHETPQPWVPRTAALTPVGRPPWSGFLDPTDDRDLPRCFETSVPPPNTRVEWRTTG